MPAIDPDAPATLIWLPDGATPSADDFQNEQSWSLEEAVKQAYEAAKDHNKRPWIKSNGQILDECGIKQVISGLRAMGMFNANRP
jgi:hypothetical protein